MMNGSVFSLLRQVFLISFLVLGTTSLIHAEEDCAEDIELALARLAHFPNIDEWTITSTTNEIRLVSKFKISVSSSQTILVEEFDESEWLANTGKNFEILIRFRPMMDYQEYLKLRSEREKWADMLNEDYQNLETEPLSDAQIELAWQRLGELKLPSHIAAYSSVYIESPLYSAELSFEPDENLQKCIWMLYRVGFLFSEIVR